MPSLGVVEMLKTQINQINLELESDFFLSSQAEHISMTYRKCEILPHIQLFALDYLFDLKEKSFESFGVFLLG